jgi:hypothetical protein
MTSLPYCQVLSPPLIFFLPRPAGYPVDSYCFTRLCMTANGFTAVHSVLRVSQRELNCYLLFSSCFLHNPKFRQAGCSACYLRSQWFLAWLILRPRRWRRHVPPKHHLTFNELHDVKSQTTELFTF